MTYALIKKILLAGNKNNSVTADKLDVFLLNNRITDAQYDELLKLLNEVEV